MRVAGALAMLLAAAVIPYCAWATVMPPVEWFDSPEKSALWQEMGPILQDWEFNQQPPMTGEPMDSLDGIRRHLGQTTAETASVLGLPADSAATVVFDLNLDGVIDQFDALELGYQIQPATKRTSIAPPTGTNKICLLRADFQDQSANYGTYNVAYFNQRFFSDGTAPKQSFRDYFQGVSYGQMDIEGAVPNCGPGGDGWCKGNHTKQWYIDNGGRNLVREAVLDADANGFNFADYDVDGDGYVDTCMLFYPNAVFSGGLWPHRSSGLNIQVDGVIVDSYFISGYAGDDSWTMTISCHEYGHILGLPDLYDVNGGSQGIGRWSLMAYQYDGNQRVPSPDPWCKCQLGWVDPVVIEENQTGYSLGNYQDNPNVLKVWTNGLEGDQYFLLANYRKKLTDDTRPGEGLLVLHIDDSIGGGNQDNANEFRKHVDVESARGYADPNAAQPEDPLDANTDNGHANDLFKPANTDPDYTGIFDDTSNPFARAYPNPGSNTFIKLENISAPGDTITLDITVRTASAPTVVIDSPTSGTFSDNVTVDVTATPGDGRTIARVDFYCNDAFLGSDAGAPYSYTFDSRCIYNGSRVIKAVVVDDAGEIGTDTSTITLDNTGIAVPSALETFESGIGAWAVYNPSGDRRWESKTDHFFAGSKSGGLGSSSGYDFNEHDEFVSVRLDLSGSTNPMARWKEKHRVASGENTIKVFATADDGATFDLLSSQTGSALTWHAMAVSLSDYVGQEIYLSFRLDSSTLNRSTGNPSGWWIDDFDVVEASDPPNLLSINPPSGSVLTGNQLITVSASDDQAVTSVRFVMNGNTLTTDTVAPFDYVFNSDWLFDGACELTAIASDAELQTDSLSVDWTTSNPGLSVPWNHAFPSDPGISWHVRDIGGGGFWKFRATDGYSSGPGMYLGEVNTHDDNEYDWLISPTLALGALNDPGIGFLHRYDMESGYDYGRLYVTTNLSTWSELAVFNGENQPWQASGGRLDAMTGQKVKLAWFFEADGGVVEEGWYVDETRVDSAPQVTSVVPLRVIRLQNLVITGSGFGASGITSDFPAVKLGSITCTPVSWSDTSITVTVPSNAVSGNLVVLRKGIPSDATQVKVILAPPGLTGVEQR